MNITHPEALKPRKTPVQARSEATVDAIFKATIQVLLSDGERRLTTTRVAERAGVSVGTMYQYFPHKQALLYAVVRLAVIATTFIGSVSSVDVVWNFGSAAVGAMAWFNIIVIVLLTKPGIATLKDYEAQKKMGLDPVFVPSRCGIKNAEIWEGIVAKRYPEQLAALKAKTKS